MPDDMVKWLRNHPHQGAAKVAKLQARIAELEAEAEGVHMIIATERQEVFRLRKGRDAAWNAALEAAAKAQEAALRKGVNPEKHSDHIRALMKKERE